jgi:hypothetical protein
MMQSKLLAAPCAFIFAALLAFGARAQSPSDYEQTLRAGARMADPGFTEFSVERGRRLFETKQGGKWSCTSCHTDDPRKPGRHAKTGRDIAPLAPSANDKRFTSPAKSEKWFRRNCKDVLGRTCTETEKGDVLNYLVSLR